MQLFQTRSEDAVPGAVSVSDDDDQSASTFGSNFCDFGGGGLTASFCGRQTSLLAARHRDQYIPKAPSKGPTVEEIDKLRDQDLDNMNDIERERLFLDIHAVGSVTNETPELLEQSLQKINSELMNTGVGTAYEMAFNQDPSHVQDAKFLLQFLRAELFDSTKAAHRCIRWLEEKLSLFGPDRLTKTITLDDLEDEDIALIESGYLQVLPNIKDRAGRPIMTACANIQPKVYNFESVVRIDRCFFRLVLCMSLFALVVLLTVLCFVA